MKRFYAIFLFMICSQITGALSYADMPSYMEGRFYKGTDIFDSNSIVIEKILSSDPSEDSAIHGKMLSNVETAIEAYRVPAEVQFNLSGRNESSYTVLLVKKGRFRLDLKNREGILKRFDVFVAKPGWTLDLEGAEAGINELIVIHVTDPKIMRKRLQTYSKMKRAHARFSEQKPVRKKGLAGLASYFGGAPVQAIFELLGPKELYLLVTKPVLDLEPSGTLHGPDRFVLALAKTPPGNGPALHVHRETDEVFMVLEGDFEVTYGDHSEYQELLHEGDVVAFPPSINRTFRNVGTDTGMLLPLVFGENRELKDIVFLPEVKRSLRAAGVSSRLLWLAEHVVGLQFKERAEINFPFGDLSGTFGGDDPKIHAF